MRVRKAQKFDAKRLFSRVDASFFVSLAFVLCCIAFVRLHVWPISVVGLMGSFEDVTEHYNFSHFKKKKKIFLVYLSATLRCMHNAYFSCFQ